jgi:hypothetical protein
MYGHNLAIMERVGTDLNLGRLESIRAEAKIQSHIPGVNVFIQIKSGLSKLFTRDVQRKSSGFEAVRFQDLDCQSSPTPC